MGERTYDEHGNVLTYRGRAGDGVSYEITNDEHGNELTYHDSTGFSYERTYDADGNALTYRDSTGFSYAYAYDADGRVFTYRPRVHLPAACSPTGTAPQTRLQNDHHDLQRQNRRGDSQPG